MAEQEQRPEDKLREMIARQLGIAVAYGQQAAETIAQADEEKSFLEVEEGIRHALHFITSAKLFMEELQRKREQGSP